MIKVQQNIAFHSSRLLSTLSVSDRFTVLQGRFASSNSRTNDDGVYDAIVVGGGSGGLAFSKEASQLGARVALIDAVEASPHGTKWGIGGTCVNVGCIPKKLMHQADLIGRFIEHAPKYGWSHCGKHELNWNELVKVVQDRIKASNWIYRVQLNEKKVEYIHGFANFLDSTSIRVMPVNRKQTGTERVLRAKKFVIATGLRPKYPAIKGAEYGISSDDLFSWKKKPGKTLVVGSSYIGLECAGLLRGLGFDVHLMIRSIPLRNFDQQCAELLIDNLAAHGVKILRRYIPESVQKQSVNGQDRLTITYRETDGTKVKSDSYDTILWAIGREPRLASLNVEGMGIKLADSGKVIANDRDETSIKNIYAIGDIAEGRPELTPTAIKAGQLLARRLFGLSDKLMRYDMVPTTIFTPVEYGCVGISEENAIKRYGEENVEVYHAYYMPYEYVVPQDANSAQCYCKVIALRHSPKTVLGLHFIGPNAAEILQGFTAAISINISSDQLFDTIPIHPCSGEEVIKMSITKRSGDDPKVVGCCG